MSDERPNVILMGLGHSGTTVMARVMERLGFSLAGADDSFAENVDIRDLNAGVGDPTWKLDERRAAAVLRKIPAPWLIKDPRFVRTLRAWLPVLSALDKKPLLVWIDRDLDEVAASYDRRGEIDSDGLLLLDYQQGMTLNTLHAEAAANFEAYPFDKIKLAVETHRALSRPSHTIQIPRVFHRVWVGGKPMPEGYVEFGRGWLRLNPGWEMKEWNETNLPPLKTGSLFSEARNAAQASDILRHEILCAFGGVYIDTDFEALKPLEPYLQNARWVGAGERAGMVSAGFIGCVPEHSIECEILRMLPARMKDKGSQNVTTGPGLVTTAWKKFATRVDVVAYGPELFYPYSWKERIERRWERFPNAVAAHHWADSWGSTSPKQ